MSKRKYRDAITGQYVDKKSAEERPETTVSETMEDSGRIKTSPDFDKNLKSLIEDLYVLSESDYPLQITDHDNLRVTSLDLFIDSQIKQSGRSEDQYKFNRISQLFKENLSETIVLIIGEEPLKTVLIIGKDDHGFYRGLTSFVVET